MQSSFWEINSKILREQYPGLLEEILRDKDNSGELKVEAAASGDPTLMINGIYVHSQRDPQKEGKRAAEAAAADTEKSGALVVLGFGLAYAAAAFAEIAPQRHIIIIEKRTDLLRTAFEQRDLSGFLSRPGIAFMPGNFGEGIADVLTLFQKYSGTRNAPYVMRNKPLTGLDEQWYASIENRIRSWTMRDEINTATLKKFGKRWIRNISRNMSVIRDLPGISRLAGLAEQNEALPVFLAAAGPGLDDVASLLPEIHKRCIVVAVDTSLRFLLRNGVEPDFTLVIDPQFWNSRHIDRCCCANTRLIVESAVYPPVLRLPFKQIFLCGSLYPPGIFLEQRVDHKGALGAGGSVATSAWDFARLLGARQIWIAGLDLAFPDNRTHFKGAQFEEKALAESTKLNPAETWLVQALRDGIPIKTAAISGNQIRSDRRLSLYASWFESSFRLFPHIHNYSLSTGGLAIPGLQPMPAQTLLALPQRREEINRVLETAFSCIEAEFFAPEETQQRGERYKQALDALHSGLRQIQALCRKGVNIARLALEQDSSPAHQKETFASLDEINRIIRDSEVKNVAGFLVPAEILSVMDNPLEKRHDDFQVFIESSLQMYQALVETTALLTGLKV